MSESVSQGNRTVETCGPTSNITAHDSDRCILFNFTQKDLAVRLAVSQVIPGVKTNKIHYALGSNLAKHEVEFIFLAARFKNDFESISKVYSLIFAAENYKFRGKDQEMRIGCVVPLLRTTGIDGQYYDGDSNGSIMAEADIFVKKYLSGNGVGLTVGLQTKQRAWSVDLPIFWVNHLKNALQKALSWYQPTPSVNGIESVKWR